MSRAPKSRSSSMLTRYALCLGFAAALAAGCQDTKGPSPSAGPAPSPGQPPATLPDKFQQPTTAPAAALPHATPAPVVAEAKGPAAADMTHMLAKEEPYYTSMPTGAEPPDGMLKAGTKALLMVPGAKFSKVMTDGGVTAYTVTDGLEPIGKK